MSLAVMFHSLGLERLDWAYRHISEPVDDVERKLVALRGAGFDFHFFGEEGRGRRSVALTFDDGYLDNWVHLMPLLEAHGMRATVFVTPEFVDPRPVTRPQVPCGTTPPDGHAPVACCAGFLSWPELVAMERSGLVRIEAHGLTHTWYPCGPRVVDFWHPGAAMNPSNHVWMLWNRFPEEKPFYLTRAREIEPRIPYGTPIYEHGKALETRRFFPAPGLDEALPEHVARHGGARFFERPDWRDELQRVAAGHAARGGEYETDEARRERVRDELARSKAILESRLGKRVEVLCWPGGSASALGLEIAREVGYRKFTLPSAWRGTDAARTAGMLPRVGSRSVVEWRGRRLGRTTPQEFVWWVRAAGSEERQRWTARLILALHLGRAALGRNAA